MAANLIILDLYYFYKTDYVRYSYPGLLKQLAVFMFLLLFWMY